MTEIFYFMGFLISMMILSLVFHYKKIYKFRLIQLNKEKEAGDKFKGIYDKEDRPSYLLLIQFAMAILFSLSWCAIGLLSNNWLAFLVLGLTHVIASKLISLIGDEHKLDFLRNFLQITLYVIISASCLFISLNHFYFKYDLELIIKGFFV